MTRKIVDPEFGEIDVPTPPSEEEFAKAKAARQATMQTRRLWPTGTVFKCLACGKKTLVGRDDLTTRVVRPGAVLVFRRLRGAKCGSCGAQYLEPADIVAVEQEAGMSIVADFAAKVSKIGSGSLGTYWPKDVVRVMHLHPDKKAFIQVIDRETALVSFE